MKNNEFSDDMRSEFKTSMDNDIYLEETIPLSSLGIDSDVLWNKNKETKWITIDGNYYMSFFSGELPPIIYDVLDCCWCANENDDTSSTLSFNYLNADIFPPNFDWKKCLWKRPEDK